MITILFKRKDTKKDNKCGKEEEFYSKGESTIVG